ncbi:unnamed protein product [Moneuplotes crassus]|uniref:Uncharacterized protein n=1 Tax=Euplotes crassus TaxID=5936 RepID=A0AAD1UCZ7_EUPCR|nr:unnamed protein product [Moneuplotes crassus]
MDSSVAEDPLFFDAEEYVTHSEYDEEVKTLNLIIAYFKQTMEREQERVAHYLLEQFKLKEFYYQETIEYLKSDIKKREDSLYQSGRMRELETKLKDFSNDALKHKALEEGNKHLIDSLKEKTDFLLKDQQFFEDQAKTYLCLKKKYQKEIKDYRKEIKELNIKISQLEQENKQLLEQLQNPDMRVTDIEAKNGKKIQNSLSNPAFTLAGTKGKRNCNNKRQSMTPSRNTLNSKSLKFIQGESKFFEDRFKNIIGKYHKPDDNTVYANIGTTHYVHGSPKQKRVNSYFKFKDQTVKKRIKSPNPNKNQFKLALELGQNTCMDKLRDGIKDDMARSLLAQNVLNTRKQEFIEESGYTKGDGEVPFLLFNHFKIKIDSKDPPLKNTTARSKIDAKLFTKQEYDKFNKVMGFPYHKIKKSLAITKNLQGSPNHQTASAKKRLFVKSEIKPYMHRAGRKDNSVKRVPKKKQNKEAH